MIETREQMIRETNAFLSWALAQDRPIAQIPRRRVDVGGFTALLREPGVREMVHRWWGRLLDEVWPEF